MKNNVMVKETVKWKMKSKFVFLSLSADGLAPSGVGLSRGLMVTHYCDVIMNTIASQITSLTIVYLTVNSDADQRKHQSSASLVFVWGIHRDRWIPRTKDHLRGKCFHLMTSSCKVGSMQIPHTSFYSQFKFNFKLHHCNAITGHQ